MFVAAFARFLRKRMAHLRMHPMSTAAAALGALALTWAPADRAVAQPQPQRSAEQAAALAALGDLTRFNSSVVRVDATIVKDGSSVDTLGSARVGTGVILDERTVLTMGYLVIEADTVEVTTAAKRKVPASVLGFDHASGLGLLRTVLPLEGRALELGDSDRIAERQRVLTLGHSEPEATPLLVVSRKPFTGSWEYLVERALFTFPPVNNWSGAALITEDDKLIGIGALIVQDAASGAQNVPGNMYVPVNLLKPIMAELKTHGRVRQPQPWLGLSTELVRGNLMVTRVSPGGPADQAGVAPGDIVLSVGDQKIGDQAEFYRRVWKFGPAGTEIPLRLLKSGDVRDMRIRSIDRNEFLKKASGI